MASKIILFLAIAAHTTCTGNSMPTKNLLDLDSSISRLDMPTTSSTTPEATETTKVLTGTEIVGSESTQKDESQKVEELAAIEKRSTRQEERKQLTTLESEKISAAPESHDDLDTAAGTNILRPLFVYRQQLAYRERVRKAGRRAVPNA